MAIPAIQYAGESLKWHKKGTLRLTRYEFLCGYVQQLETPDCKVGNGIQLQLWIEHASYNVRAHNFGTHERLCWETFGTMTEANKYFYKKKRELGL